MPHPNMPPAGQSSTWPGGDRQRDQTSRLVGLSWGALPRQLPSQIRAVAAVIERAGKYLITQRRSTAVLPGLWEFPGGKVEPGESDEAALRREVRERIGVDVEVKARIASRHHQYDGYSVDLNLYQAVLEAGHEPS